MASNTAPTTKFMLKTYDGGEFTFKVDEAVAKHSPTIKKFIDSPNFGLYNTMRLPLIITGKVLSKVIEYCEKHVGASSAAATTTAAAATNAAASSGGGGVVDLTEWDEQFVNAMDRDTLFGLVYAATCLGITSLLKLGDTALMTKVTLRTSDGEEFMVDEVVAKHSPTIKKFIDQPNFVKSKPIPLPAITGKILSKVIEYSKKHAGASAATATTSAAAATATTSAAAATNAAAELNKWDEEFAKAMDKDTLFGLVSAAYYLDNRSLFELASSALVQLMPAMLPDLNL